MAAKLTDRSSIPAVVAELTLEEKAHLLTGASSFTTYAVERLGIPSCTVLDGGTGINFQQYWGDVYSRALKRDSGKTISAFLVSAIPQRLCRSSISLNRIFR